MLEQPQRQTAVLLPLLQLYLIEDGKPINPQDYKGIIVLEEHVDQVGICSTPCSHLHSALSLRLKVQQCCLQYQHSCSLGKLGGCIL